MNSIASNILQLGLGVLFLLSIAVYSLIHLANYLLTWMNKFESAIEWQIATLSLLLILSIGCISYILKGAGNGSFFRSKKHPSPLKLINYKQLSFQFTCGIIDGLLEKSSTKRNNNEV